MKKHPIITHIIIVAISQLFTFVLMLLLDPHVTLVNYINRSFYVASFFLLLSLAIFTVNTGFFDVVTRSFRLLFSGKDVTKENVDEMRPMSQIFSFNYSPLFTIGISSLAFSLIALFFYYY